MFFFLSSSCRSCTGDGGGSGTSLTEVYNTLYVAVMIIDKTYVMLTIGSSVVEWYGRSMIRCSTG